jgi:hypothetical protein
VNSRHALIAVAALTIGGSVACSSNPVAQPAPGTLPAGTANLSIDGKDIPTVRAVDCEPPEQAFTTIKTGDDNSGATVMISNAGKLTVEFVRIRNLDGFTGDYNRGLGGDATVALTGTTYQIAGAAFGYGPKSPEPTTAPFTIKVSC